ncbi:MAG: NUDIX domain-containing protein [Actinobacteria bacterium]|nr:NUDIX domain-containing protein [Actinomycetota bacterium]
MSESSPARPEVCVGAVVVDDGQLLLIRRGRGMAAGEWSVPGGRVEAGETLAEAVVRELAEETGLEGVCGELVGWTELVDAAVPGHAVILDFHVDLLERREPTAGDDATEARWVDRGDVAARPLAPGLAEFLHDHGVIATIT